MGIYFKLNICYIESMKIWKAIILGIALAIMVSVPAYVSSAPNDKTKYNPCQHDGYADKLFCATNEYRLSQGKIPLKHSTEASRIAKDRANYLCESGTFTHEGWLRFLNTEYIEAGENLAQDFDRPNEVLERWKTSYSHNKNIVEDWGSMGIYTNPCNGRNVTAQIFLTKE